MARKSERCVKVIGGRGGDYWITEDDLRMQRAVGALVIEGSDRGNVVARLVSTDCGLRGFSCSLSGATKGRDLDTGGAMYSKLEEVCFGKPEHRAVLEFMATRQPRWRTAR